MIKISYILPVYKVEPYIEKCILSIIATDLPFDEYEIIAINDGSPDNCKKLIEVFQKSYSNIILINQDNQGVSAARNKGIEIARGEYLMFVDSDDFLATSELKSHYDFAKQHELDILLFGRSSLNHQGNISYMLGYEREQYKFFSGIEAYGIKDLNFPIWDSSVGRLYNKKLIMRNKLRFPESVVHLEDGVFVRLVFIAASKVSFVNINLYTVYERPDSASRSRKDKPRIRTYIEGYFICVQRLIEFKKEQVSLNPNQLGLLNLSIVKYTLLPFIELINEGQIKLFLFAQHKLRPLELYKLDLSYISKDSEYFKWAVLFNKAPIIFSFAYVMELFFRKIKIRIIDRNKIK